MRWAIERQVLRVWIRGGGGFKISYVFSFLEFRARRALRLAAASLYALVAIMVSNAPTNR